MVQKGAAMKLPTSTTRTAASAPRAAVAGGRIGDEAIDLGQLAKLDADYDPFDKVGALNYLQAHAAVGELVTGLIYMDSQPKDMHANLNTVAAPLNRLSEKELCPGAAGLDSFNASHR